MQPRASPLSNLLFIEGSADSIPFKQQFDKVVSFSTLHWVMQQDVALKSIAECLKPGGAVLLIVPGKKASSLGILSEQLIRTEKWAPYFPYYAPERVYFTPEEYLQLLQQAGLQVQSIEASETITVYKDRQAVVDFFRPLVNFIDHLPADLKEEFVDDVVTQMIRECGVEYDDGTVATKTPKMEAIAIKPGPKPYRE